jgi:hypothetical protein
MGIAIATKVGRKKEGLDDHFSSNTRIYRSPKLYRIQVESRMYRSSEFLLIC